MADFLLSIPAANLSLANDVLVAGQYSGPPITDLKKASHPRTLRRAGLSGSAAAFDCVIDLKINGRVVCRLWNSVTGGLINRMDNSSIINVVIPANVELIAEVVDAGGTNVAYLFLDIDL